MEQTEQEGEGILWAKYLHALTKEGIPEERLRYYTGWVENFRRFQKNRRVTCIPSGTRLRPNFWKRGTISERSRSISGMRMSRPR
jgi:hypothetical protein